MKIKIFFTALLCTVLFACNTNKQSFIPGTYVNHSTGKYSVANDTLIIEPSEGNRFKIDRKTGFNLVRNGKKGEREYETEKWNTIYNEKIGVLTETKRGKTLILYPDSNMLMIGTRIYKKVN